VPKPKEDHQATGSDLGRGLKQSAARPRRGGRLARQPAQIFSHLLENRPCGRIMSQVALFIGVVGHLK
jgi:hypothetical protein